MRVQYFNVVGALGLLLTSKLDHGTNWNRYRQTARLVSGDAFGICDGFRVEKEEEEESMMCSGLKTLTLFELGPHHYYRGKGGLVKSRRFRRFE